MTTAKIAAVIAGVVVLAHPFTSVFAQGSLTPPGAPGPMMKSLDQVEARTAITNTSSLVTISQPGSYYLTHNLTVSTGDAIDINTNQVTLDLNGFTISSTAASANNYGIYMPGGNTDVTVLNGHIKSGVTNNAGTYSGSGFIGGIVGIGANLYNLRVSGVSVSGCLSYGIALGVGNSTTVESCTVKTAGFYGIFADNVSHCVAHECGSSAAIYATTVSDCRGAATGAGAGILAVTASNCSGTSSGSGPGLSVSSVAMGCNGSSATGIGITAYIANSCRVVNGTTNITYKYNMP